MGFGVGSRYRGHKQTAQHCCKACPPLPACDRDGTCSASPTSQSQLLTNTCPHVQGGHEAIIAQTMVSPWHIGALAAITDVQVLFTLIHVWGSRIGAKLQAGRDEAGVGGRDPPTGSVACSMSGWLCLGRARGLPRGSGRGLCLPTCTRSPIRHQRVAVSTAAPVAALSVNTVHLTPTVPSEAFVGVCSGQGRERGTGLGDRVKHVADLRAGAEVRKLRLGPGAGGVMPTFSRWAQSHPRSPGGQVHSGSRCGRSTGRRQ